MEFMAMAERLIEDTAQKAAAKGYSGMLAFLPQIAAYCQAQPHLDNPDGWEQIFTQYIYPSVMSYSQDRQMKQNSFREMLQQQQAQPYHPYDGWKYRMQLQNTGVR
jgi:hypothetical protein